MDESGDESDDLDVNLQWPRDDEGDQANLLDVNLGKAAGQGNSEGRLKRQARRSRDRPAPRRAPDRPPTAEPPVAPTPLHAEEPEVTGASDRISPALSEITAQITALSSQLTALSDLVADLSIRPLPDVGSNHAPSDLTIERYQELQDQATVEILDALSANEAATRRVEQVSSSLAVELAEVGQTLSDQARRDSTASTVEMREGLSGLGADVEALGESTADALAQVVERLDALDLSGELSGRRGSRDASAHVEGVVTETAETVTRIETLVEDLMTAAEERPVDVSELTSRTLQRLGLTVGAKVEAVTTTAVEAIEVAVSQAIDGAVTQFKEMAPPVVDRSTTAAITRLEERVASLTRQRDEHDRETAATLNSLEETVGRLASAQAEDLERILDTIESASVTTSGSAAKGDGTEKRLGHIEAAIDALGDLPSTTEDLATRVAEQFDAFNTQIEALRRRLTVRARPGSLDGQTLQQLADLIADRLEPATQPPAQRSARPARRTQPTKAVRPIRATLGDSRRQPPR